VHPAVGSVKTHRPLLTTPPQLRRRDAVRLHRALAGYADSVHWIRATANDWVTVAGLAFSAVGIILPVAIGQRWPLSPTVADEDSQRPS
jgi:hypothetical protein